MTGPVYEVPSHPENLWTVTDCFSQGSREDPNNVMVELTEVPAFPDKVDDFEYDSVSLFARDFARTSILVEDPTEWYKTRNLKSQPTESSETE